MPDYGTQPPPPDTVTLGGGAWKDPNEGRPSRKWWYVGGGAVLAVALIAGGTVYAATQLRAQHDPGPAAGLPSDTIAYAAVDLDPSAGQKIEAIKALRKFPAFTQGVKLDPDSDLRKLFVQKELTGGCNIDWSKDVEPWLGNDIGGAVVPTDSNGPQPVAVLAVKDQAEAKKDLPKLLDCAPAPHGLSIANGWAVIAASDSIAQGVSTSATGDTLADDSGFKTWVDRTGDPGVATFYASKSAGTQLSGFLDKAMGELGSFGGMGSGFGSSSFAANSAYAPTAYRSNVGAAAADDPSAPIDPFETTDPNNPFSLFMDMCPGALSGSGGGMGSSMPGLDAQKQALKDFQGGAATLRFASSGFEVETASASTATAASNGDLTTDLGTLPADTAIAAGAADDPKVFDQVLDSFFQGLATGCSSTPAKVEGDLSKLTGLTLPDDLTTVFGHGATLAVSGALDPASFDSPTVPTKDFPVGIRLHGDPGQITSVLKKLPGSQLQQLIATSSGDGVVAVGPDAAYRDALLKKGDLGSDKTFADVVPHADKASAALFISFDRLRTIIGRDSSADSSQVAKNLEPLSALGASSWVDDGVSHGLLRLSTK